ncbi:NAD-dependent protein deacetylase [Salinicola rhizosphaerae]|uniref:NAD-dependent protein deacetylase n=1 Tax=Salinicola rhizosphaerae TaxID=1443141 RepID=A0ABQ3EEA8_9GAMM|nr:NAD-dependent protein deacetylase [Salinicola rhizosphaerae]GHB32083.1 NAD-dependent protein deacetylase 2 [Salinicola rhizosphaerae]
MPEDPTLSIEALAAFVDAHPRLFVLTGAGVSTDSGIPDYRDARGDWKRPPPVSHQAFMGSAAVRRRYWARSLVGFRALAGAHPGPAHIALATLERQGRIVRLVTQNVDGLHQRAGSRWVTDLHGQADVVKCMNCGATLMRHALHDELARRNPQWLSLSAEVGPDGDADLDGHDFSNFEVPACQRCRVGILKPDVVFFGDNVPKARSETAFAALDEASAMLVVGSSLMVYSGFRFARHAAANGKPIACLNLGATRADALYDIKVSAAIGPTLTAMVDHLDGRKRQNPAEAGF